MNAPTALLTFSIGPVHGFISQARRVADLWAGSDLLSHLIGQAVRKIQAWPGAGMVFPFLSNEEELPPGLPNRFVCRVPREQANGLADVLRKEVEAEWNRRVLATVEQLRRYGLGPSEAIWAGNGVGDRQTDHLLEVSWSWVSEESGYSTASREGARRFAASRLFRPFSQISEPGEKCAVCGERTALPDGDRPRVRKAWEKAFKESEGKIEDEPYLRWDQARLCLVCATKRFYPRQCERTQYFAAFNRFEPAEETPYFAIVALDGDRMGEILGWPESRIASGKVEAFHRDLSQALTRFAESLRTPGKADLALEALGRSPIASRKNPQLVYAGGEDVLLVCDPRDALGLAWKIREAYRKALDPVAAKHVGPEDRDCFTISAAVLFAHTKHPAGLLFRDVQYLLDEGAKGKAGRDAIAIRLAKRGGVPVEAAFRWNDKVSESEGEPTWVEAFDSLVSSLAAKTVSSRQTVTLRRHDRVLAEVFTTREEWESWLRDRLSRGEVSDSATGDLARRLAPFFLHQKTGALRILRFLVRELES